MKSVSVRLSFFSLIAAACFLAACSGLTDKSSGSGSGGSGGSGATYKIGGTVTGLDGSGMVLQDNGKDNLTINANGTFTFATAVSAYAVTILTQPSNPTQTCTVTNGSGTASAAVTNVQVTCAAPNAVISANVSGLSGSNLVLQDNGNDNLTVNANGTYQFKNPVNGTYNVIVLTQPTAPNEICAVANGSGTATSNTVTVNVTCQLSYTIGGTVNGLLGSGLVLQDNGGDNLSITASGNFTFKTQLVTGSNYAVSVLTEPTNPSQNCTVSNGSGVANSNINSVVINCPAVTYSVGGTVVGLRGATPTPPNQINLPLSDNSFQIQNNLGNTLVITENGPFTFATPEALNDQYQVSIFHGPSSQGEGCTIWGYKGVVTANVSNIVIDCAHDDWTWIDGTKTAGTIASPQYGSFPSSAPTTFPNPLTNTPGARYGAAGWVDQHGSLFLFGGNGWELTGKSPPDTLNAAMSDMWVCDMSFGGDFCQWQLVGGYDPTVSGSTTVGALIILNAQSGYGYGVTPAARFGAATWTDSSGHFWLFGGSDGGHFLNSLWMYDPTGLNSGNYTTTEGTWTFEGGSALVDQPGNYTSGTLVPGARTNAVTWTDGAGHFWLFGGYGYDSVGTLGFLNDLWEYTGGAWVFVSGGNTNLANQNGIYGTQGTALSTNMPGGRQEAVGWADTTNGYLWLFGGEGLDSTGTANGILNDLWMYNIGTGQWTWVAGANAANKTGIYPTQTVTGPANTINAAGTCGLYTGDAPLSCAPVTLTGAAPGSRWGGNGWIDASGNLWLFGGWGLDSTGTNGNGALNDFWVYTPNSTPTQLGTWAWVKGSNTGAQNGTYGSETYPFLTNQIYNPGGRSNATRWIDRNGQLWLFGGEGYDSTSTTGNGYLNDMWRYLMYPPLP